MKAAVVTSFDQPPSYADFPEPQPDDGTAVGTVVAASLKNLDRGLVSGKHYASSSLRPPFIAGVDGVARLEDGSLVYTSAVAPYGMMAERAPVNPAGTVPLPDGIDPVVAAAVPNPALSAWFSLEYAAKVAAGQNVLVLGATGVTGSVAVQLAKAVFGAGRVVAAGRNSVRLDALRAVGADASIQLTDELTEHVAAEHKSHPIDVVLDYLWGPPAERVLAALANTSLDRGYHATRYVQVGAMAGPTIRLPAAVLRSAGIEMAGVGIGSIPPQAQARVGTELLPRLFGMVGAGTLRIDVQRQPLSEVREVWAAAEPPGTRVVLVP